MKSWMKTEEHWRYACFKREFTGSVGLIRGSYTRKLENKW